MKQKNSMSTTLEISQWVKCPVPNSKAPSRLFCLPYAGGSSQMYRSWIDYLPSDIELCLIELPGRGTRLLEKPIDQFPTLVQETAEGIRSYLDRPFAFFGHSMGALLSFELTRLLRREGFATPKHLFASGFRAPHLEIDCKRIHSLPEAEFVEEIRRMGGTPEAVIANAELRELVFPPLRADFAAIENYQYQPGVPLNCPITVFGGLQDKKVSVEALESWRRYTSASFSLQMFSGDHFFLNKSQPLILKVIQQQLQTGV